MQKLQQKLQLSQLWELSQFFYSLKQVLNSIIKINF
jgi:hypothetical protein